MRGEKGLASAVDWIIAVGIFLVYFGLVFVFFKPGGTDTFNADTLVDVVESNFKINTYWNVTKTPIFVDRGSNIGTKSVYLDELNQQVRMGEGYKLIQIPTEVGDQSPFSNENADTVEELGEVGNDVAGTVRNPGASGVIQLNFIRDLDKMTVNLYDYGNDLVNWPSRPSGRGALGVIISCPKSNTEDASCTLHYTVGASENYIGISVDKFQSLRGIDYEQLKNDWGFPELKQFRIVLYSNVAGMGFDKGDENTIIGAQEIPLSENVYVREFNSYILNDQGIRIPVTINVRVW